MKIAKNKNIPAVFGERVFSDSVMKERLPKDIYKALQKTKLEGGRLELSVANVVAAAMKEWAVEKGATHFTHWFQPLTGITAEKHEAFISPQSNDKVIMEFSGKELVKGEPDASSFPHGGLRVTFEARGYTVWDTTSPAFIKNNTLYIPTAYCSYGGHALDMKTPLLRSMDTINKQALRILKLFDKSPKRVDVSVGPEQEYFLVDRELYNKRIDLRLAGRTVFGARPPKGQEMSDHYFGAIKPRVLKFMQELDEKLWKLGVFAKTRHNEVAPGQYEFAPVYTSANLATDDNQITMELLKNLARKHGLACLLHEKPFKDVNGSGKHINWSLATYDGANLLEPGETPYDNAQFLLFLVAIVKAIDEYQDLLRASSASAGNDHRLGGHEAPPAIISVFIGTELAEVLEAIELGSAYKGKKKMQMEIGTTVLPPIPKDSTDRNRTSPFAFTGNKFEFRMLGSSFSAAGPTTIINTAVAEILREFADKLEKSKNFKQDLAALIKETYTKHKRIIFNGDGYAEEWQAEASQRGLSNLKTTPEALAAYKDKKAVGLFTKHSVLSREELLARYNILVEGYCMQLNIEALCMVDMARQLILPAALQYQKELAELLRLKFKLDKFFGGQKEEVGLEAQDTYFPVCAEEDLLDNISNLTSLLYNVTNEVEILLEQAQAKTEEASQKGSDPISVATFYKDEIVPLMVELREAADELELLVAKKHWPIPTYVELLFDI
ncbi:MAG: glutamine synthetase III [Firmicutes bacterium]|nr:glutamine synthetase III [Bacillota bacterium]